MLRRRLVGGCGKPCIAPPAAAAAGRSEALPGCGEVKQPLTGFCVVDNGSDGNGQFDVLAVAPCAIAAFAMAPSFSRVFWIESKVQQRIAVLARKEDYIAAPAAITSAGPSTRNELFAPEGETSIPAVTGFDGDDDLVDEHHL
jgi:hypothetical protein